MVDAGRGQAQHLRGGKGGKPHRTRGADDDLGESPGLQMIDDLEERGEAELLQFVFGQLELPDRGEVLERNPGHGDLLARDHDLDGTATGGKGSAHPLDRGGDTVHIVERVGEPGTAGIAELRGELAPHQHRRLAET